MRIVRIYEIETRPCTFITNSGLVRDSKLMRSFYETTERRCGEPATVVVQFEDGTCQDLCNKHWYYLEGVEKGKRGEDKDV